MPESIEINGKSYSVGFVLEKDAAGNEASVLMLTSGDEVLRLSPNTTPEELESYADPRDGGHE